MIEFFTEIHQRLLNENKFSKYLLYAIGEIVLVVIVFASGTPHQIKEIMKEFQFYETPLRCLEKIICV